MLLLLLVSLLLCAAEVHSLNVRVAAVYSPAPGEIPGKLGPNQFTAGSVLALQCLVEGHSGIVSYRWSLSGSPSTPGCSRCDIDTSSTTAKLHLGIFSLYSYYAGVYTCTVNENGSPGSSSSSSFPVSVVGELNGRDLTIAELSDLSRCWYIRHIIHLGDIIRSHSQQWIDSRQQ